MHPTTFYQQRFQTVTDDAYVHLTPFPNIKDLRAFNVSDPEQIEEMVEHGISLNGPTEAVYLTTHLQREYWSGNRTTSDDYLGVVALTLDADAVHGEHKTDPALLIQDIADLQRVIAEFPIPPTCVIDSGGGYYPEWWLTEPAWGWLGVELLDRFKAAATRIFSDAGRHLDSTFDRPRIFRMVGSVNQKNPDAPAIVNVLFLDASRRYTADELLEVLDEPAPPAVKPDKIDRDDVDGALPGDEYNAASTIESVIAVAESAGFHSPKRLQSGRVLMWRPGKPAATNEAHALTIYPDDGRGFPTVCAFSEAPEITRMRLEPQQGYDPFGFYVRVKHGGDFAAAMTVLNPEIEISFDSEPAASDALSLPPGLAIYQEGDLGGGIAPVPAAVLDGPIGEYLTLIEHETEASREALGAGLIAALGARLGRTVRLRHGNITQPPNIFVAVVGPSGLARKGTADSDVRRLLKEVDPEFVVDRVHAGFGSGEGLVRLVQDPAFEENGEIIAGTTDQRLLINEGELATVFRVANRDGNILSDKLRDAFDGVPMHNVTVQRQISSKNHTISITGGITPDELVHLFGQIASTNGLGSRFLWIWSNPDTLLPFGGNSVDLSSIAQTIRTRPVTVYRMSGDALGWWEAEYADLARTPNVHASVRGMVNRSAVQVMRIALVYAATEGTDGTIDTRHLEAGHAWVMHSQQVVVSVLGGLVRDELAGKLLAALRRAPGHTFKMSDLYATVSRNYTSTEMTAAVNSLTQAGLTHTWTGHSDGGRPPKLVIATTPKRGQL